MPRFVLFALSALLVGAAAEHRYTWQWWNISGCTGNPSDTGGQLMDTCIPMAGFMARYSCDTHGNVLYEEIYGMRKHMCAEVCADMCQACATPVRKLVETVCVLDTLLVVPMDLYIGTRKELHGACQQLDGLPHERHTE